MFFFSRSIFIVSDRSLAFRADLFGTEIETKKYVNERLFAFNEMLAPRKVSSEGMLFFFILIFVIS